MLMNVLTSPRLGNTIIRVKSIKSQTYPHNSIVESLTYSEEIEKEIENDRKKLNQLYLDYKSNRLTYQQFMNQRPIPREPFIQLDQLQICEGVEDKRIKLLCTRNRIIFVCAGGSIGFVYRLNDLGKFKYMYDIPSHYPALPWLGLVVRTARTVDHSPVTMKIKIDVTRAIDQTSIFKTEVDSFVVCGQSWLITRVNKASEICLVGHEFKEVNKEIEVYQHCLNYLLKDISQVDRLEQLTITSFDKYLTVCYPLSSALTSTAHFNSSLQCAGIYYYDNDNDNVHNLKYRLLNYKEDGLSGDYNTQTTSTIQNVYVVKVFNTLKKEITDQYLFVGFNRVLAGDKIRAVINSTDGIDYCYFKIGEESGKLGSTYSDLADIAVYRTNEKWLQLDMGEESMNKVKFILQEFIFNPQLVLDYIF